MAKTVRLSALATDAGFQTATLRNDGLRLARRELPALGVPQDQALLAWLALRAPSQRHEFAVTNRLDVLGQPDSPDAACDLKNAFDQVFASLGV
jgi:hypothetical protein